MSLVHGRKEVKNVVEIIAALISAVSCIIVAVIAAKSAVDRRADEDKRKEEEAIRIERDQERKDEMRLSMKLMSASCKLSVVTATAMRDGHTNGTLAGALEEAGKAQEEYQRFLEATTAANITRS